MGYTVQNIRHISQYNLKTQTTASKNNYEINQHLSETD